MRTNTFLLDFPNDEVKRGFTAVLANNYLKPKEDADSRKLFKVGVNFSSETGTISDWAVR